MSVQLKDYYFYLRSGLIYNGRTVLPSIVLLKKSFYYSGASIKNVFMVEMVENECARLTCIMQNYAAKSNSLIVFRFFQTM